MKLRRIAANLILVAVAALALRAWHEIRQGFIARAKPSTRRKKFDDAQELAHKRYGGAFRKLAQ